MLNALPHVGLEGVFTEPYRTEDMAFSPSGRILAAVATSGNLFLFAVDTATRPVRVTRHAELTSDSLATPHGIDFLSEDVIVIANRSGWVSFFRLPAVETWSGHMTIHPIHEMGATCFGAKGATRNLDGRMIHCGPGSVRVSGNLLYVCCNHQSTVSAHPFRLHGDAVETGEATVVAQAGLIIADSVALTSDGQWMAVSEHQHGCVLMYRPGNPVAVSRLRAPGLRHPHGLCFDPAGRRLYVADAGERWLHVFVAADGWSDSATDSAFRLPAVELEAYRRTHASIAEHVRPLEGGIKGLDLDPTGRILATTCQNQMLRFFECTPATTTATMRRPTLLARTRAALARIGFRGKPGASA